MTNMQSTASLAELRSAETQTTEAPYPDLREILARKLADANDDGIFDEADQNEAQAKEEGWRREGEVYLDQEGSDIEWYRKLAGALMDDISSRIRLEVQRELSAASDDLLARRDSLPNHGSQQSGRRLGFEDSARVMRSRRETYGLATR